MMRRFVLSALLLVALCAANDHDSWEETETTLIPAHDADDTPVGLIDDKVQEGWGSRRRAAPPPAGDSCNWACKAEAKVKETFQVNPTSAGSYGSIFRPQLCRRLSIDRWLSIAISPPAVPSQTRTLR